MIQLKYIHVACYLVLIFTSCNYINYTPRSKKNVQREKPSILIFDRIIDFRIEQMGWPTSKMDFMSKGKKYYEVFEGFRYNETKFKIIDSNNMVFSFYGHRKDVDNYNETGKIDFNNYRGTVRFYKENDKFLWKLKMK